MPSSVPFPTASPRRRALHERTPSQTNERPASPLIRLVNEKKDDIDFYSATPYPTKPAQVLPPNPGKGQGFAGERGFRVSDLSLSSAATSHPATGHVDTGRDVSNAWELSSSVDIGNSSSQVWEEDPKSSRSSFPDADQPDDAYDTKTVSGLPCVDPEAREDEDENNKEEGKGAEEKEDDSDDVITLPPVRPTVKAVPPESSSPRAASVADSPSSDPIVPDDHSSSPNVVPIGDPSSPNIVPLDSSSPNLIPLGSSSPNIVSARLSDSSLASSSLGTVIHHPAAAWRSLSSEGTNSQSGSFHSSPPLAHSPALSTRTRSRTASSGSAPSVATVQAVIDGGVPVQYPTIRAPSSSSYAESTSAPQRPARAMTDRSSGRWNPRLSTVPSQWSEEQEHKLSTPSTSASSELVSTSKSETRHLRSKSKSTIWVVDESSGDEHLDRLSNLPQSSLRHIPSAVLGSHSSSSRSNSVRSLKRPGSSSSSNVVLNTLPNWVRLYYSGTHSGFPLVDSRPSTASRPASPARFISQVPGSISRPRTRARGNSENENRPPRLILDHPADPRSHWKGGQQADQLTEIERLPSDQLTTTWSPHLHPDKGQQDNPRNTWVAPSMDSTMEPFFGRRNVQVYSFCLGFVFPLGTILKLRFCPQTFLLTCFFLSLAYCRLPPSSPEACRG